MCAPAAAASSRSTVMRTISEPARARAATWAAVAVASAVSVLVIDWTMIGAAPPTVTPPTFTATEGRRGVGPAESCIKGSIRRRFGTAIVIRSQSGNAETQGAVAAGSAAAGLLVGAALGGAATAHQVVGGIDQGDVREGL